MNPKTIKGILASAILALLCAFVFAALTLYGVISVGAARVLLCVAWLIGVVGTAVSEIFWRKPILYKIASVVTVGVVLAVGFVGLDRWASRKKNEEGHLAPAPLQSLPPKSKAKPSFSLSLALITTIHRMKDPETHGYMKGGQNDLIGVLRISQRNGTSVRHVRGLQVVGDVAADCGSYISAFHPDLHGEYTTDDLENECAKRKPFFHLSLVSFPTTSPRIDPNDEEFIRFVLTNSLGAISFAGNMKDFFGFHDTNTGPKYPMTSPTWSLLVRFSAVNSTDLTGYGPTLRDEVNSGKVKFQTNLDGEILDIAPREIRFPWPVSLADFQINTIIPQDLFYGIDNGNRVALPSERDSLVK